VQRRRVPADRQGAHVRRGAGCARRAPCAACCVASLLGSA
jgi:hypothetical protein